MLCAVENRVKYHGLSDSNGLIPNLQDKLAAIRLIDP